MPLQWIYQVRGRLRPRLDAGLAHDLAGLVRNAEGTTNALVLPRTGHALPRHLPYAFAQAISPHAAVEGPAFGPRLAYDGSRFDGISGAQVRDGELLLGLQAEGLEREANLGLDGTSPGPGSSRLATLLDFFTLVLFGPKGEVVGRIRTHLHSFGHPLMRCADGRIRIVHASGLRRSGGPADTLPELIPDWCIELGGDECAADLDEGKLALWFRSLHVES